MPAPMVRTNRRTYCVVCLMLIGLPVVMGCRNSSVTPAPSTQTSSVQARLADAQKHGDDPVYLAETARLLNNARRFNDAGPLATRAVELSPNNPAFQEELIRARIGAGHVSQAYAQVDAFAKIHRDGEVGAEAQRLLGSFYVAVEAPDQALPTLERAAVLDPRSGKAWRDLARAREHFLNNSSTGDALKASDQAVTLLPDDADVWLIRARLLTRTSDPKARAAYEKAIGFAPRSAEAHRYFADYLLKSSDEGDTRRALAEAELALQLEPDSPLSLISQGAALHRLGRSEQAVAPLETAARLAPNAPLPASELVRVYMARGDAAGLKRWRGELLARTRYTSDVQTLFAELSTRPADHKLLIRLARLHGAHGEIAQAVRYQAMASDAPPDSPTVLQAVARDLERGGYQKAAQVLRRRAETR